MGIEVATIRRECVSVLLEIGRWQQGRLGGMGNEEFALVMEEMGVQVAGYTFREVYGMSAREARRRRREREREMEEWEAELESNEKLWEDERGEKRKRAETVGRGEGKRWKGEEADGDAESDKENV